MSTATHSVIVSWNGGKDRMLMPEKACASTAKHC